MDTFQKTQTFLYPRAVEKRTPDFQYWKTLEFPVTRKEHAAVSHIEFSSVTPYNYVVTSSAKVELFDHRTLQPLRCFRHFKQVAYSASYRHDGQLLVAGGDEPVVQLFDATNQKLDIKRCFRGHAAPVHLTKFTADGVHIFSGSDDKTVRVWDIGTETELLSFANHQDYVRCGTTSLSSKDVIVTGSYDHSINLYDIRCNSVALSVDHGHPVESVVMFPGGGLIVSAGGNVIKVWDVLSGGRLLTTFGNHHKTITSLCFASNFQRLVSASLDRHVKFYDINTYQVVHTLDYPSAILSVAVAPDDSLLAVGMADGLLSIQRRKNAEQIAAEVEEKKMRKQSVKARYKLAVPLYSYVASKDDTVVQHTRRQKLQAYDRYFKKFEYSKALDAALLPPVRVKMPEVTISVIQELMRRRGLRSALVGRDEKSVRIILKFIQKNICDQRFNEIVLDVLDTLLDIYEESISTCSSLRDIFCQIRNTLMDERKLGVETMELLGSLDTIMSSSNAVTDT